MIIKFLDSFLLSRLVKQFMRCESFFLIQEYYELKPEQVGVSK